MRNIIAFAFLLFLVFPLSACDGEGEGKAGGKTAQQQQLPAERHLAIRTAGGQVHDFNIELAVTPEQMEYGLMNRTELAENAGMLFWFGNEAERAFWMKNTLIPLDMIFIRKNGVISHIHENAKPMDLSPVPSNGAVAAVLEVNGGTAKRLGIKPGDVVEHVFFGNAGGGDSK